MDGHAQFAIRLHVRFLRSLFVLLWLCVFSWAGPARAAEGARPLVRILFPQDRALISRPEVQLRVALRRGSGPPPRLEVAVDGVYVTARGIVLASDASAQPTAEEDVYELVVSVPSRDCTVQVRAVPVPRSDVDRASIKVAPELATPAVLTLRWEPAATPARANLYILSIGVSAYRRSQLSLRFPGKDARDFASTLRERAGELYGTVTSEVLVDEAATRAGILAKLAALEKQTTAEDVVALFLAGHGINDADSGEYYFLAHDADPEAPSTTMVSKTELQSSLRKLPGKTLLFLDSCHAGNVFPDWRTRGTPDTRAWAQELFLAGSSVIVWSAATGTQTAKEADAWNNSAFAKALVEGLQGEAAYHAGRPITVNMLELYISERVRQLTSGTQTPAVAKPGSVADFPLAVPPLLLRSVDGNAKRPPAPVPAWKKWWVWTILGSGVGTAVTGLAVGLGVRRFYLAPVTEGGNVNVVNSVF